MAALRSALFCAALALLCAACVRGATHPDEVLDLPGLSFTPTFKHYSGYIALPDSPKSLHYWFAESQNDPASDPVLLWLNGGPGCSSMLGMLTENGPFRVAADGVRVDLNPWSWNRNASVLYLESPAGVGYSYSTDRNYTATDASTAADNLAFLQGFLDEYPEFRTQRLYVTGESFAGNYVPELVQAIMRANEDLPEGQLPINVQGMAVGNPTMDWAATASLYWQFISAHAIVEQRAYDAAFKQCAGVFYPAPTEACAEMVGNMTAEMFDINPYDITGTCAGAGWGTQPGCFTLAALSEAHQPSGRAQPHLHHTGHLDSGSSRARTYLRPAPLSQTFVPCIDLYPIRTFLNNPSVMSALHIDASQVVLPWDACSQVLNYGHIVGDMVPIYEDILQNSDMRVLVYSGDVDSCVPYLGTEASVRSFPSTQRLPIKDAWQSWTYVSESLPAIKQVGGKFMQWAERLAYATVRGAGHMVPHDRAEAAYNLIMGFMNDPNEMRF